MTQFFRFPAWDEQPTNPTVVGDEAGDSWAAGAMRQLYVAAFATAAAASTLAAQIQLAQFNDYERPAPVLQDEGWVPPNPVLWQVPPVAIALEDQQPTNPTVISDKGDIWTIPAPQQWQAPTLSLGLESELPPQATSAISDEDALWVIPPPTLWTPPLTAFILEDQQPTNPTTLTDDTGLQPIIPPSVWAGQPLPLGPESEYPSGVVTIVDDSAWLAPASQGWPIVAPAIFDSESLSPIVSDADYEQPRLTPAWWAQGVQQRITDTEVLSPIISQEDGEPVVAKGGWWPTIDQPIRSDSETPKYLPLSDADATWTPLVPVPSWNPWPYLTAVPWSFDVGEYVVSALRTILGKVRDVSTRIMVRDVSPVVALDDVSPTVALQDVSPSVDVRDASPSVVLRDQSEAIDR